MIHLDPIAEYQEISDWIASRIDKSIKPRTFVQQLGKHLTRRHPIRVRLHESRDHGLDEGDFTIGAEYDCELDEQGKKHLIINFIVNWPKTCPWLITADAADRFAIDLTETLVHEYQHQHQYRTRYFRVNRGFRNISTEPVLYADNMDQEYLGQPDEIDAYAANIAARFYLLNDKLGEKDTPKCFDLLEYFKVFGPSHSVTKKLLKKIYKNLEALRQDIRIRITPKPHKRKR